MCDARVCVGIGTMGERLPCALSHLFGRQSLPQALLEQPTRDAIVHRLGDGDGGRSDRLALGNDRRCDGRGLCYCHQCLGLPWVWARHVFRSLDEQCTLFIAGVLFLACYWRARQTQL